MRIIVIFFLLVAINIASGQQKSISKINFDIDKDLLLIHYDCKTDVDDLHSVAAFATLLSRAEYNTINYHAIAGTYGMQDGLYVPPNSLFELSFGQQWSDAHNAYDDALIEVVKLSIKTLRSDGIIWISEAGQSDFTFDLIKRLEMAIPNLDTSRIHVVQHSNWNEKVTTPEKLAYVKSAATYHKIPDGNSVQNGTPGFQSKDVIPWSESITNKHLLQVWELAIKLSNKYNGNENRYLNKVIAEGGLDFSDFAEICWILNIAEIEDVEGYFKFIAEEN
jgi:uncharacterized protein YuzB (UPF0349 family)